MDTVTKIMLVAGVIALAATLIIVFKPWNYSRWMEYNYIKAHAVEIAEAIELGKPIKLKTPAYINNTTIEIKITLPNEKPLTIKLNYSKIILKTNIQTQAIIRGRNTTWANKPLTCVYQVGSKIIIDPKPIVNYTVGKEYNQTIYIVTVTLFKIPYTSIRENTIIYFSKIEKQEYMRTYSYSEKSLLY
ncbi:MAG: hypothetical protein DRN04_10835, partial [Thermoprotei archaeon]